MVSVRLPRDWGESDTPRYCGECIASSGVQVSVTCSGVTLSITRSGVGVSVMCLGVGVCVTPPRFWVACKCSGVGDCITLGFWGECNNQSVVVSETHSAVGVCATNVPSGVAVIVTC